MTGSPAIRRITWKNVRPSVKYWVYPSAKIYFCATAKKRSFICFAWDRISLFTPKTEPQIGRPGCPLLPEDGTLGTLHCTPGSATILGLMNDSDHRVRLLMEREVYEAEYLSCHPCICTSSLKLKTRDVLDKLLPYTGHDVTVVDL